MGQVDDDGSVFQLFYDGSTKFAQTVIALPMQNAFVESFSGRFRDELLNETLFSSLAEAREKTGAWKEDYNRNRPDSSLCNFTPQEFATKSRLESRAA